jgi:hypothetical protein
MPSLWDSSIAAAEIRDLTPAELGLACACVRAHLTRNGFREVLMSPIDRFTTGHPAAWPPTPLGQLRFNTEPEIWSSWNSVDPFFSITPLFRHESSYNIVRRPCFFIIDYYMRAEDSSAVLAVFFSLIQALTKDKFLSMVGSLPLGYSVYDPKIDSPVLQDVRPELTLTTGYQPENSFFEVNESGRSTREEIFVSADGNVLEVAALGAVGVNKNPEYMLNPPLDTRDIPSGLWGLGIGLERLLLVDRLLERWNDGD